VANWSYLCATNRKVIYPSYGDRPYDSRKQTVASVVNCVPLLWLGLFRPADLVRRTFIQEGRPFVAEAPLCARSKAIRQFRAAVPHLEDMFHECGPLDGFAELFLKGLEPLNYRYLTIELEEIECMAKSRKWFRDTLRKAIGGIGTDYSTAARDRFIYLAQLFALRRFPPPRLLLDKLKGSDDDFMLHGRVLGSGSSTTGMKGRKAPWDAK
jgi:hypothetical protein